jgi:hypothetical protein
MSRAPLVDALAAAGFRVIESREDWLRATRAGGPSNA